MSEPTDPIAFYRETIRRLEVIIGRVAREEGVELDSIQVLVGPTPDQDRIILHIRLDGEILRVPLDDWKDVIKRLDDLKNPPEP